MPPNINQSGLLKTGAPRIPNQPPREPGELQPEDVVAAQEISGFSGARVFITLQKKTESKLKKLPNQDNILVHPKTGLVAVMDGVGGSKNGELASKVTERELPIHFETTESESRKTSATELIEELTEIPAERYEYRTDSAQRRVELERIAKEIVSKDVGLARKAYALLKALQDANFMVATTRGATTACAGLIHETANGEKFAIIANVGDSGAFIRRKNGKIERATPEDSVEEALKEVKAEIDGMSLVDYLHQHSDPITGKIPDSLPIPIPVTQDNILAIGYSLVDFWTFESKGEKKIYTTYEAMKRTLTAYLGNQTPSPRLRVVKVEAGDEILFCTDGIIDKYDNEEKQELDLEELSQDMDVGSNPVERLDNLRVIAHQKATYKDNDDVAMVLLRVE